MRCWRTYSAIGGPECVELPENARAVPGPTERLTASRATASR